MKKVLTILFFISFSCSQQRRSDKDFIEKLIDLTTETSSEEYLGEEYVLLTNLYDTLAHSIPDDKDEKLILVERLKKRGFKVTEWGRGNFPPLGARIINIELTKGNCVCTVCKIYYYAAQVDTIYQMAEGINCKRVRK